MGANWRRPLHFELPVRCLGLWQRTDVAAALRDVLSFLSEDEYTFIFRQYKEPPSATGYFTFADSPGIEKPESVILFSGGLDSLGGAVQEVVIERRPVALVTHQSNTKFIARLRMLRQSLDLRAGHKPLHVTVGINKAENLNHEYTQRSRSFLYASLGATIARMSALNEVRFYENGTVSLNLPISRQVVGAKATRTTHPRVLSGFAQLFSLIGDARFHVTNNFLWKTKGEVVKLIVEAHCADMISWSSSCTHIWELCNAKPHCGSCSQCIDRRFAILAAGAAAHEHADTYSVDLLTEARDKSEPRTMLAAYVETAQQVSKLSEIDFFKRFGEAARVIRHLPGTADENARKIYDLYMRHSEEVMRVVDAGLREHASEIRSRSLPEDCLLRLVHDPSVPAEWSGAGSPSTRSDTAPKVEADFIFRPRAEVWDVRFDGHQIQTLLPLIGYAYLRQILRFPGKAFTLSDLVLGVHGERSAIPIGDGGKVLDAQAMRAFAHRLADLDEELDEARENNDIGRQSNLALERDALSSELKAAGFKTHAKRNNSDLDKIRKSVSNAMTRAIEKIEKFDRSAGGHLRDSVSLGFSIRYEPKTKIPWSF